jgi:hypothetical protein
MGRFIVPVTFFLVAAWAVFIILLISRTTH